MLRRALQYQRLCGGVIALHEEDPDLSGDGVMHEGEVSAALGLAGHPGGLRVDDDRPRLPLSPATRRPGSTSSISLPRPRSRRASRARQAASQVSCEVTPHHLTLTDEAVRTPRSRRFKMNPPLRAEDDRQALIEGLRDGTIDCIATDHAPHAADEKEVPFEQAAMGVTGLEVAFAALHTDLVLSGVLDLAPLVEKLGAGAELFGLPRHSLAEGSEASLALCDLGAEWTVGDDGYESRSDNCCSAGRKLQGRVLMTVAAGQVAYRLRSFAMGVAA